MAIIPIVPQYVTVHPGRPDTVSADITVTFPDYIKNVASCEISPTMPESALRAHIHMLVSFALHRIGSGFYRSRGYRFDITGDKDTDRPFAAGRNYFENVGRIVDECFNDCICRRGSDEPVTDTAAGSEVTVHDIYELAKKGMTAPEILKKYYGSDIVIKTNIPVKGFASFPAISIKPGSAGGDIKTLQLMLNRISVYYPTIPKINPVNGIYDHNTAEAVKSFRTVFNCEPDIGVDKALWYKIQYAYDAAKKLCEPAAGCGFQAQFTEEIKRGDRGKAVTAVQNYLSRAAMYMTEINPVQVTGYYGAETEDAVISFCRARCLRADGVVDKQVYDTLFDVYNGLGMQDRFCSTARPLPKIPLFRGVENDDVAYLKDCLCNISYTYPSIPAVSAGGLFDEGTRESVMKYQALFGLPANDIVDIDTWNSICALNDDLRAGLYVNEGQYPGYVIDRWLFDGGEA